MTPDAPRPDPRSPLAATPDPVPETILVPAAASDSSSGLSPGTILPGPDSMQTCGDMPTGVPVLPSRLGGIEILGTLGAGGMGVVLRGFDPGLQRPVAVKILRGPDLLEEERVTRFLREARTAAQLRHRSIIAVHAVGTWEGMPYVVMDLIEGTTLDERIKPGVPWGLRERVEILRDVARAVEFAHGAGVIHRDLKPANVMIDREGVPVVLDFGLARSIDAKARLTVTGQALGTPGYMPPEQIDGDVGRMGFASDVFALGAMLYELLTFHRPFEGDTVVEIFAHTYQGDVVAPRALDPTLPRDLETVCLQCLEPEPEARYARAGELVDELERWLSGRPVKARPIPRVERWWRTARRNRAATAWAASVLVAALAWGAWAAHGRLQGRADLAAALERAAGHRAAGRTTDARDEYRRALDLAPADPAAREGTAWADREERRAADAGRKSRGVADVLVRWERLAPAIEQLEGIHYDSGLAPEEKQRAAAVPWAGVETFLASTPADPAAQAAARALAGWARRLAGHADEGHRWMEEASAADPDVPYGELLRALVLFTRIVEAQPLPGIILKETGLALEEPPAETAESAEMRAELDRLIAGAARAPVWGSVEAEGFRPALAAVEAVQRGKYAEAEGALTAALGAPALRVFGSGLRLARSRVRYLLERFPEAVEDALAVLRVRPRLAAAHAYLGMYRFALAGEATARGADPRPGIREALASYDRALELDASARLLHLRGSARLDLSAAEAEAGLDGADSLAQALRDLEAAAARDPDDRRIRGSLGLAYRHAADLKLERGEAARDLYERAIAAFGGVLEREPANVSALTNRAMASAALAATEADTAALTRLEHASADLARALAAAPEIAELYNNRGTLQVGAAELRRDPRARKLDYTRAIADFDEAVRRAEGYVTALSNRGAARSGLGEAEAELGEDPSATFDRALEDLTRAIERAPERAGPYTNRGAVHQAIGDWLRSCGRDARPSRARAVADLETAARLRPGDAGVHANVGEAWFAVAEDAPGGPEREEALQRAITAHTEAVRRRPGLPAALRGRAAARATVADLQVERGEDPRELLRSALADLDEALRADPDEPKALGNRGAVRLRLAQAETARGADAREGLRMASADLEEVLKQSPANATALQNAAMVRMERARAEAAHGGDAESAWREAIAALDAALARTPDWVSGLRHRAEARLESADLVHRRGDDPAASLAAATADLDEFLRRRPDDAEILNQRGVVWAMRARARSARGEAATGEYERALADFRAASARDPRDLQGLWNQTLVLEALGRIDEAADACRAARALAPEDARIGARLAALEAAKTGSERGK